MGCCFQDLFNLAGSILVLFPSSSYSMCFISVHVVHPYSSVGPTAVWKKSRFILLDISHFYMIDSLSIAVYAFARHKLTSLSGNEMLLPTYLNLSTNFRTRPFRVEIAPSQLKHVYFVLSVLTWKLMPPAACSRLCIRDSAWVCVFARSAMSSA